MNEFEWKRNNNNNNNVQTIDMKQIEILNMIRELILFVHITIFLNKKKKTTQISKGNNTLFFCIVL